MSNFTPLVSKEYEFGGDKVQVTFARFKRKHMLEMMPFMAQVRTARENDDSQAASVATNQTLNLTIGVLPEYVKTLTGLKDTEGNEIGIEVVADEMYFIDLAADIAMDILNESVVLDAKNAKK